MSVGNEHDNTVCVWAWQKGVSVACNKVASKVRAVCFNETGTYFVTVGAKHVKFWYGDSFLSIKYDSVETDHTIKKFDVFE